MAELELDGIGKRFGAVTVIPELSLRIEKGEFLALLGPSGCGKSTTLRMIAGLEEVSCGRIRLGGRDVTHVSPKGRNVAMVFQNYALYPHMTVAQNMAFSLRLSRVPAEERREAVERAAQLLGLDPLLDRYPGQLSGGQRQRVAMGRAIVRDPTLFLFDEPLSNLDAALRVQMREEIKALHDRLRTTTVYVTHDQVEAMSMADRIAVMRDGRVEQVGPPHELFETPANIFVARFVGTPAMDLLPGVARSGGFWLDGGGELPFALGPEGRRGILGLRPHAWSPDEDGADVTVEAGEYLGAETRFTVRLGGDTLSVILPGRQTAAPGGRLRLAYREAPHLFDETTGARITD